MALVVYEENPVLTVFNERWKRVQLNESIELQMEQHWQTHGVAGVVWEMVTSCLYLDMAIVLGTYICKHPEMVKGLRVLELGAGSGIPSIAALHAGASHVTVTDRASVLPLLRSNLEHNLMAHAHLQSRYTVAALDWTQPEEYSVWTQEFDVILGADLVYDEQLFDPLKRVVDHFLDWEWHRTAYLAVKVRYEKDRRFVERFNNDLCQYQEETYKDPNDEMNRIYEISYLACCEL